MKLLYFSRIVARSPHGEGFTTGEEESDDESVDQHRGRGSGDRVVPASGACHRVGDFRLDAVLPGPRHGRRAAATSPFLVEIGGRYVPRSAEHSRWSRFSAPARCRCRPRSRKDASAEAVYRRPLGHDPKTLDPARISDIYSLSVSPANLRRPRAIRPDAGNQAGVGGVLEASRDGLTWTFDLRKGAKFHHGREVTARRRRVLAHAHRRSEDALRRGRPVPRRQGARQFREGLARAVPSSSRSTAIRSRSPSTRRWPRSSRSSPSATPRSFRGT